MKTSEEKQILRVGKINFINTVPFFGADLEKDRGVFDFFEGSPSEINAALCEARVDVGLASSLVYASRPEDFVILPGFCISANRDARSVRLVASEKVETLRGKTIALSSKSLSSSSVLKILMKHYWKIDCQFEISDLSASELMEHYPAALLIGDEALFFDSANYQVYDVSELWRDWTGKPFCFALWLARRAVYEESPELLRLFEESLRHNLQRNMKSLEDVVIGPQRTFVIDYLRNLNFHLEEDVLKGLSRFYELAGEMGFVGRDVDLRFCDWKNDKNQKEEIGRTESWPFGKV